MGFGGKFNFMAFFASCMHLENILPFAGRTISQIGPPPNFWAFFNQDQGWSNGNWQVFDGYAPSLDAGSKKPGKTKETGDADGAEDPGNVEPPKTPEEIVEAQTKAAAKTAKLKATIDTYNKTLEALQAHAETLSGSEKSTFETILANYKKVTYTVTMEKYMDDNGNVLKPESAANSYKKLKDNLACIQLIYNDVKDSIKANALNKAKEDVTSPNNTSYTTKVTGLAQKINDNNDATFGILKESSGVLSWDSDVDIMELLSTWNSTESTKSAHIMNKLADKYSATTGETKSRLATFADNLHEKLIGVAQDIVEDSETSVTQKDSLNKAITALQAFGRDQRLSESQNYSNAFDNLYRAIRLVEAEKADAKLSKDFEYLGEDNPYKDTKMLETETKNDLNAEGLENAQAVTAPAVKVEIPADAKTVKINNVEYKVSGSGDNAKVYKPDETELSPEEKAEIGIIEFDGEGNYKITKGSTSTYYNAQHCEIQANKFNQKPLQNPANATEKQKFDQDIQDYGPSVKMGLDLYNQVDGWRSGKAAKMIKEDINKDNVIGVIEGFHSETTDSNIIARLSKDDIGVDLCNRIVKAVLRKATELGYTENNSKAYKNLLIEFGAKITRRQDNNIDIDFTQRNNEFYRNNQTNETYKNEVSIGMKGKAYTETKANEIWNLLDALIKEIKGGETSPS